MYQASQTHINPAFAKDLRYREAYKVRMVAGSVSSGERYVAVTQEKQVVSQHQNSDATDYPSTKQAVLIMGCLLLVLFLVALDRLIIGVAIPSISDEFHSTQDVGWYGSAYLLTSCAFMLFLGKVYTLANPKWVYLISLGVFEVGSALCGAAPNSKAFILGRAIAGLGNAGLMQGAITIMVYIIPLPKRPQYMGFFGLVFGVASAIGPLLGGALTDGPGWRWCFYINLPCGAVVFTLIFFLLDIPLDLSQRQSTTWKDKLKRLDPVGSLLLLSSILCLVLALQWGGVTYAWSDARIIVLLIVFGLLLVFFIITELYLDDNATIPKRILGHRSILAGIWYSFFNGAGAQTLFYFVPIWFQAVKEVSATKAGLMSLPIVIGLSISAILTGIATKRIGYFTQWMIISSILTPIGSGLITTFSPNINHEHWIGYLAIVGIGFGCGMQQSSVAAQTVLPRKDVSIGAALMMFSQTLGGAIFISVGNTILDLKLVQSLKIYPGIDTSSLATNGITALRQSVPLQLQPQVLMAFNHSFRSVFYLVVGLTCSTIFGALAMEWRSVKRGHSENATELKKETSV